MNLPGEQYQYPIRAVAELTGVHPVTLRAWERRYRLIEPQRTAKGHRLYSGADIDRIRRALALLETGIPVSRVRPLLDTHPPTSTADAGDGWQRYAERMRQALESFDENALDSVYNDALSLYPLDLVTRRLIAPLLQQLGEIWRQAPAGIAREHFFTTYLRNKLGARLHHLNTRAVGARVVAACPAGEHHELGLILFALTLAGHGYRVVVLGADLPASQIVEAARIARCSAVVLAATAELDERLLAAEVATIVRGCEVAVMIGGEASVRHRKRLVASGAVTLGTDFTAALERLDRSLADR